METPAVKSTSHASNVKPSYASPPKSEMKAHRDLEEQEELLHSGPLLGNLPSLSANKRSPGKINTFGDIDTSTTNNTTTSSHTKKKKNHHQHAYKDCPPEFLCELCRRPMSDPVKSIFGHYYEKSVIENWIQKQGHICPMTGRITICLVYLWTIRYIYAYLYIRIHRCTFGRM